MTLDSLIGLAPIKAHLKQSADNGRIAHAQIFSGANGSGTLSAAIAYARYLLCNTSKNASNCNVKLDALSHPDLHFAFPVTTTKEVKKHPVSDNFLKYWREFVAKNPYADLHEWLQYIGAENKQGLIGVEEAHQIVKKLSLKSFDGGYKVMIIWMADRMNVTAANKLLKVIEEPPSNTVFILVTEHEDQILETILSRCQVLQFPKIGTEPLSKALEQHLQIAPDKAHELAHRAQGNYNTALKLLDNKGLEEQFEKWFITWVRAAFQAKGNKSVIHRLIIWSEEIASHNRETQTRFLLYCTDFLRQALLLNYSSPDLVFFEPRTDNFKLENFAPFVHHNNIENIYEALEEALYHVDRNGSGKMIFTDLSIKLTRFLHALK